MNTHWRQRPDLALHTFDDLVAWLDEIGIALFLPKRGVLLPSAREATLGRAYIGGPAWMGSWGDESMERLWGWKDRLGAERRAYYGAGLLPHLSMISLALLPAFLALAPSRVGMASLFEEGLLGRDARQTFDVLTQRGATGRNALRRALGFAATRLGKALAELEHWGLVARVGVERDGSGWAATIYATFEDAYPEAVTLAAHVDVDAARRRILAAYSTISPPASVHETARALGWARSVVEATVAALATRGIAPSAPS